MVTMRMVLYDTSDDGICDDNSYYCNIGDKGTDNIDGDDNSNSDNENNGKRS